MENKNMPIPDFYRDMPHSEFVLRMMMARDFFGEVLNILFYSDDKYMRVYKDEELKIDAEMISEYCEHIRVLYQAYYESEKRERHEILSMLEAYCELERIAYFEMFIDDEHDIISEMARMTVAAILQIEQFKDVFEHHLPQVNRATTICEASYERVDVFYDLRVDVFYDFEEDTPQDVWNKFNNALSD